MKILRAAAFLSLVCGAVCSVYARESKLLDKGWRFTREDNAAFSQIDCNDKSWQSVTVPHDWAIYGPFSWDNDRQNVAITQDGQKEAMEHAGRTGGLPFVGTGWYRNTVDVPELNNGERVTLMFDGAMSHAKVYVNGKETGYWPYGYNSFYFDVTDLVRPGEPNQIAVRLENLPESSRWYPGAGLYRNVHMLITDAAHIPVWGTYVTTPEVTKDWARVEVETEISLPEGDDESKYSLRTTILNPQGTVVISKTSRLIDMEYNDNKVDQSFVVKKPELWSPESPTLYVARTELVRDNTVRDEYSTTFGIRSIEIRPNEGFFLNGELTKFKGVCLHHDLGPLGAAVNDAAIRRQIRMLKDMGVNAIRTSHNMPAPEFIKACDEMGMMVMSESFDEWKKPKVKNGYNLLFDEWAEKDLTNLIRHYRNNPSVVMWCIGNEVSEQWHPGDVKTAYFLQNICHKLDPSRPVTQGMDGPDAVLNNNFAAIMDVAGFNYRPFKYKEAYHKLPQQIILGTETASTLSSRGVYKFPVERKSMAKYDDHQASSYDVEHCGWSDLPEDNFIYHDDLPYCIGEFVWTGFDYLGEPTPYYSDWPSHSSLFGIIDLAGIPKDRYYLYRSHWNTDSATLHVLPHWTWPGREGEVTPVFVYTSYPEAELFINGKSQGRMKKDLSVGIDGSYTEKAQKEFERQQRYRLMWLDTKYEPGTLRVVAYDAEGNPAATTEVRTAGKPDHLVLTADRADYKADGKDMAFINVKVVDKNGTVCPDASQKVKFSVKGAGKYEAVANGDPSSLESFQAPQMSLFHGQLTAVVRTSDTPGSIEFTASAPGVKSAKIRLVSK